MDTANTNSAPSTPTTPAGSANPAPQVVDTPKAKVKEPKAKAPKSKESKVSEAPKAPEAAPKKARLTPEQVRERSADIESKIEEGKDLTEEDTELLSEIQALEFEKEQARQKKKNIKETPDVEAPVFDKETPDEEGLTIDETLEEVSEEEGEQEDSEAYEIPEGYEEAYELTKAKSPLELTSAIKDYQKKIDFAINWKKQNDIKVQEQLQEKDGLIEHRDAALLDQTDLLAEVLMGNEEAIEHAKSLMAQAGRNVHTPMKMPPRESFADPEAYDLFVTQQNKITQMETERARERAEDEKRVQEAQDAADREKQNANITDEIGRLCEDFADLGLDAKQAKAMYRHKVKTGEIVPAFKKIVEIGSLAAKKGLTLEEAYILLSRGKGKEGARAKEQVNKILNPRRNHEKQPGLSGVTPKAPATPGGKLTRDQIIGMSKTGNWPKEWMMPLSNGKSELDPDKVPDYASAILEDIT